MKTQHLCIILKIDTVFQLVFFRSIFDASFCTPVEYPIHAFSEQVEISSHSVLTCLLNKQKK